MIAPLQRAALTVDLMVHTGGPVSVHGHTLGGAVTCYMRDTRLLRRISILLGSIY